jgi:hypothetical protein
MARAIWKHETKKAASKRKRGAKSASGRGRKKSA